jgi:hypothetical protein
MKYRSFFLYQTFFRQTFFIWPAKKVHTWAGMLQVCLFRPQRQEALNRAVCIVNVAGSCVGAVKFSVSY